MKIRTYNLGTIEFEIPHDEISVAQIKTRIWIRIGMARDLQWLIYQGMVLGDAHTFFTDVELDLVYWPDLTYCLSRCVEEE